MTRLWGWLAAAGGILLAGLLLVMKLMGAGRDKERAAQADRNAAARKDAADARDDALAADDPRHELQRDFSRPDGR